MKDLGNETMAWDEDVVLEMYLERIFGNLPESVAPLAILGGGAIRAFFDGTTVKDYDLFFRTHEDFVAALEHLQDEGWYCEAQSSGGSWSCRDFKGREWNLVGFAWGTPEVQVERFDFRCCAMVAWVDEAGEVCFLPSEGAIKDACDMELYVRNNNGTERTLARISRYIANYGYELVGVDESAEEPLQEDQGELFPNEYPIIGHETVVRELRGRLGRCPRPTGFNYND